jgi:hypothetical protein
MSWCRTPSGSFFHGSYPVQCSQAFLLSLLGMNLITRCIVEVFLSKTEWSVDIVRARRSKVTQNPTWFGEQSNGIATAIHRVYGVWSHYSFRILRWSIFSCQDNYKPDLSRTLLIMTFFLWNIVNLWIKFYFIPLSTTFTLLEWGQYTLFT